MTTLTRRRFLRISAAAASSLAVPSGASASGSTSWKGIALGAPAKIVIEHTDRDEATDIIATCREEIERLENLFSLYRANSVISLLNAVGELVEPPADFLAILSLAGAVNEASGGAFDPTIQPLWEAHARAYAIGHGVNEIERQEARARTGWRRLVFRPDRIAFTAPGMRLTLNGIAQGYVTDSVANLLKARGLKHVLIDIGEVRAVGARQDGTGWPVQVVGTRRTVSLNDMALATSATFGTIFDAEGRVGHMIDPERGKPVTGRRQVSVTAPSAALADALSTAACILPEQDLPGFLDTFKPAELVDAIGVGFKDQ